MAKKMAKKGKRMAMGGPADTPNMMSRGQMAMPGKMPGRGMGREMEEDEMDRGREREMERRMRRGRDREMEGGMGRYGRGAAGMNVPTTGKPAIGGGLPPVQNMGPGNMPPGRMPGAPRAALTQSAVQPPVDPNMLRAMAPGKMAPGNLGPMRMRGGGIARKGKGLTMAKGGLVKGAGCCQRGVKKPRMK